MQSRHVKRIVHIVRQYRPSQGGLEDFMENLCREQMETGLKPAIVTCDRVFAEPSKMLPAMELMDGVPVRRIPFKGSTRYPIAPQVFSLLGQADIIHVHAIDFFFDALSLGRLLHRVPLVCTTHGGFFHTRDYAAAKNVWFNTVTRLSARGYDAVVACSGSDYRTFSAIMTDRLHVIENGVDTTKFANTADPTIGKHVVTLGRFSKNKRLDRLIGAMAKLIKDDPAWTLDIIGSPGDWSADDVKAEIARHEVTDNVSIHVKPTDAEIREIMANCSFFASASEFEGFGIALVEAMSAGLVPVVHGNPTFKDFARKNGSVRVTDFADPSAAAQALIDTWMATSLDKDEARDAVLTVAARYSWPGVARQYAELYQRVMARRQHVISATAGQPRTLP